MSNCVGVAVDAAAELEDALHRDAARVRAAVAVEQRAGDAAHEVGVEALVAGRDGRVDREHAVRADARPRPRRASRPPPRPPAPARRAGTPSGPRSGARPAGSMPSLRSARTPPTPEDELLVEAHLAAADVEDVRDRAVGAVVLRLVGVEEQDRDAADLGEVDGDRQRAAGQLDVDVERIAVGADDALDAAGARGRSRGRRAPGGRPRRSSGGSSPCDRGARRRRTAAPCRWPDFV